MKPFFINFISLFISEIPNQCLNIDCNNHGVCVVIGSNFKCRCQEGFEGTFCQTIKPPGESKFL